MAQIPLVLSSFSFGLSCDVCEEVANTMRVEVENQVGHCTSVRRSKLIACGSSVANYILYVRVAEQDNAAVHPPVSVRYTVTIEKDDSLWVCTKHT